MTVRTEPSSLFGKLGASELVRYLIAGVANNVVGYGAFLVALKWLQLPAQVSNAVAYAVGLQVAFLLNRFFVFRGSSINARTSMRFLVAFAVSFGINQGALLALTEGIGMAPEIAQLFAMAVYMAVFYLLNKYLVWSSA
jgi:putative flippase GtrA